MTDNAFPYNAIRRNVAYDSYWATNVNYQLNDGLQRFQQIDNRLDDAAARFARVDKEITALKSASLSGTERTAIGTKLTELQSQIQTQSILLQNARKDGAAVQKKIAEDIKGLQGNLRYHVNRLDNDADNLKHHIGRHDDAISALSPGRDAVSGHSHVSNQEETNVNSHDIERLFDRFEETRVKRDTEQRKMGKFHSSLRMGVLASLMLTAFSVFQLSSCDMHNARIAHGWIPDVGGRWISDQGDRVVWRQINPVTGELGAIQVETKDAYNARLAAEASED